jgi:fatty-acyl-CoA synthase
MNIGWRGENVSTMEVASVMTLHPSIDDITVYGITLPKYEGQVGMATIVSSNPDDVARDLRPFLLKKGLPLYAHPRFVRVIDVIPVTQTHKHQKAELKKEGIDVYKSAPVYVLTDDGNYARMTDDHYRVVQAGLAKF